MKVDNHVKKVVNHVKKHHHKYLLFGGIASWVFLVTKVIMLFATSYFLYNANHDASFAEDIVLSWTVEETIWTGEDLTWTGEDLTSTGEDLTWTGEDLTWTGEDLTWTGEDLIWTVEETIWTGEDLTWTGEDLTWTGEDLTWTGQDLIWTGEDLIYWFELEETVCSSSWFTSSLIDSWMYSWIIDISWQVSEACSGKNIDLQFYDHNNQWVSLWLFSWENQQYLFDSILLWSGLYSQTGLDMSGNVIVTFTGVYSGISSYSWTGYHFKWIDVSDDIVLSEVSDIVIDNVSPIITGVTLSYSVLFSGFVGENDLLTLSFDSSEELTWLIVSLWSWSMSLSWFTWNHYIYQGTLSGQTFSGYIPYSISYQDIVGNTWMFVWTSSLIYDYIYPEFSSFLLSWDVLSFETSELVNSQMFVLVKNTTNWWSFESSWYSLDHQFTLPVLITGTDYDVGVIIDDEVGNVSKAALSLVKNNSWSLALNLLATLYGTVLTTHSSEVNFLTAVTTWFVAEESLVEDEEQTLTASVLKEFKEEVDNFTQCRNDIDYMEIKLQIKWTELSLNMPDFKKSQTKKLVNAFILYILKNLEKSALSDTDLLNVAQNFDSFLVILKLVKDDDNSCRQNLSNYHLEQFKQSLEMYGIDI